MAKFYFHGAFENTMQNLSDIVDGIRPYTLSYGFLWIKDQGDIAKIKANPVIIANGYDYVDEGDKEYVNLFEKYPKSTLKEFAKELGVYNSSLLTKKQLVDAIMSLKR